jgi:hypothetical protein
VRAPAARAGFVLVGVLLLLLAVGLVATGMSLEAGLATLGARSAAGAAEARTAARAALTLAVYEALALPPGEAPPEMFGPWPSAGLPAIVNVATVSGSDPPAMRLRAVAEAGRSRAEASAVITLEPSPRVLEWRDP